MSEDRNREQIAVAIGTSSVDFLAQQFMAAMKGENSADLRFFIQAAAIYRFGVEAWNEALKRNAVH